MLNHLRQAHGVLISPSPRIACQFKQKFAWFRRLVYPTRSSQPGGAAYYAFQVRQQTTTNRSADNIHALGLSEVKRIRGEMEAVATSAGFDTPRVFVHVVDRPLSMLVTVTVAPDGAR